MQVLVCHTKETIMRKQLCAVFAGLALCAGAHADVVLGPYDFNSAQFGNTLIEGDGGVFSSSNWLNVANADPGNPGYLTGANFDTGLGNLASGLYTIGYGTAIVNGPGADLGIVTARYSDADTVRMDVSTDGGATFAGFQSYGPGLANATGVACSYFYAGGGPFACELFVTEVDLSDFGIALGASINTVAISGAPQLDLIRVAGFAAPGTVPEPGSLALGGLAALGLAAAAARRRRKA
jgi:MYXO-CTERM domain-containing protein